MAAQTTLSGHRYARADKAKGAVYTPPDLARFLVAQAFNAHSGSSPVSILDPACGDGALLMAASEEASSRRIDVAELVGLQLLVCVGVGRFVLVVCGNCFCCSVTAF